MDIDKRMLKYGSIYYLPLIQAKDLEKCGHDGHLFISVLSHHPIPLFYLSDQDSGSKLIQEYKPIRYRGRAFFELSDYLDQLQEALFGVLFQDTPVSDIVHGYLRNRSVFTNFAVHRQGNPKTQLKIDLYRAFGQITSEKLRQFLLKHWTFSQLKDFLKERTDWYNPHRSGSWCESGWWKFSSWQKYKELIDIIERRFNKKWYQYVLDQAVNIFLYSHPNGKQYLAQGATVSPWLFNRLLYELDEELKRLVEPYGYYISRFGDDISITTPDEYIPQELVDTIFGKITEHGFKINWRKTGIRHLTPDSPLIFPGIILHHDGRAGVSQRSRRRMRAHLFKARNTFFRPEAVEKGINSYLRKVSELS